MKIKNETKRRKARFLIILLGTLSASLLENLLADKGIIRAVFRKPEKCLCEKEMSNFVSLAIDSLAYQ